MQTRLRQEKISRPMTVQTIRKDKFQARDPMNPRLNAVQSINTRNFVIMDKQNYKDHRDK